ncbi:hypothetical protein BJY04DRAFT_177508 [Aspergillus karnatakaensis]|uniref:uncharacterized protein n=1 Tax=Aspergillus karnatakaensis TaxID=1810916 RepID=UPI003CCDC51E
MGKGDRDPPTKAKLDRFRTPDKPASASKLKRAPARLGLLQDTPAPTAISTATPSTASTSRSSKRTPTWSVQGQPTLTQIDFVTVPRGGSDDEFDYIGNSEKNHREVIEIEDDDNKLDNEEDADYEPSSTSRSKRVRGIRFDPDPPRPRKTPASSGGKTGKGRRKSGEKKEKVAPKDDKTLTQMNYVRRIVLEPDDDVKLEYAYITPRKKDTGRQTATTVAVEDVQQPPTYTPKSSNQHKRRRLSPAADAKKIPHTDDHHDTKVTRSPSTPRKSIRTEIPSSQSPESSGVAFITSSQFRGATRSPSKRTTNPLKGEYIKEELSGSPEIKDTSRSPVQTPYPSNELPGCDNKPLPPLPLQLEGTENTPLSAKGTPKHAGEALAEVSISKQRPRPSQRTVVYETDAESDDDFEGGLPDVPSSDREDITELGDEPQDDGTPETPNTESQELPLPPIFENDTNTGLVPSESHLLSDASICYQRVQHATQFPLEPVPTINTQKMAELFPEDSNGLHTLSSISQPSSPMKTPRAPRPQNPQIVSQTQESDPVQPESQEPKRTATEVVPESSPVARHADHASLKRRVSSGNNVVVQVESSQPVDRAQRHQTAGAEPRRRGVITRSQILTSSVMESITLPAFWMSSQDSVGEPYTLPDAT